jgi:hypothetical protein
MTSETKPMNKWPIILVICLIGCGISFWANRHSQQSKIDGSFSNISSSTDRIKIDDETELEGMIYINSGNQGGLLIAVRDVKLERNFGISAGLFGSVVNENEIKWTVLTQLDTPDEKSHVVSKNSVCLVRKSNNVVTLLTLTDKGLTQGLIDMSLSENKEVQELAEYLFEAIIRYAYQKEFVPTEHANE